LSTLRFKIDPTIAYFPVAKGIEKENMVEIRKLYNKFQFEAAKAKVDALKVADLQISATAEEQELLEKV
jgi:hypothetical protein